MARAARPRKRWQGRLALAIPASTLREGASTFGEGPAKWWKGLATMRKGPAKWWKGFTTMWKGQVKWWKGLATIWKGPGEGDSVSNRVELTRARPTQLMAYRIKKHPVD